MAARIAIARTGRGFCSIPHPCPKFAVRRTTMGVPVRKAFSVSAIAKEKKYTEDHEWVELSDNNIVTLGISKYASQALGDVIYVELPEVSLEVGFGDAIGAVESVKSASDILTPVAGKVVEANSQLEETPGLLNKDPEGEGWIAKLEVQGAEESLGKLMSAENYGKFTDEHS